jgi:hypothetical protein
MMKLSTTNLLARSLLAVLTAAGVVAGLTACGGDKPRQPDQVNVPLRDLPEVLRGTIGAEAALSGTAPNLVSGIGLVVGLAGTGGGPYPASIQGTMERELGRRGIGVATAADGGPFAGQSPKTVLARNDVAIVVLEAAMIQGLPEGARFDVTVRAIPGSSTTSLEGGTLWTTDLRLGPATTADGPRTGVVATARGPIFINPFADRSSSDVVRTMGRVMLGATAIAGPAMQLRLESESFALARAMTDAINSRFPAEPSQRGQTATGRSGSVIEVRMPPSYGQRPDAFVQTLLAVRTNSAFSTEAARQYVQALETNEALADELAWCLIAVGRPAIAHLEPGYQIQKIGPRLAALRAGAELGDPRAGPYLRAIALDMQTATNVRAEATRLMGRVPLDGTSREALAGLTIDPNLTVRVAAYESLLQLRDPRVMALNTGSKFDLHVVETPPTADGKGLIYVTQQGRPRVVVFGRELEIIRPMLAGMFDDRLMFAGEAGDAQLRYLWRGLPGQTAADAPEISAIGRPLQRGEITPRLANLLAMLSRDPSPERAGELSFGLSYSQVASVAYQLQRQGAVPAAFAVERDALSEAITRAMAGGAGERPEGGEVEGAEQTKGPGEVSGAERPEKAVDTSKQNKWVVPIEPKKK